MIPDLARTTHAPHGRTAFAFILIALFAVACSQEAAREGAAPATSDEAAGPSGLVYEELVAGEGASPGATDKVTVHYTGRLESGDVFDSSVERGRPATFPLNGVIPCWTEGVQRMKVGGKAVLTCPSEIAYGPRGRPGRIPPNATLIFEIELLGID